MTLPDDSGFGGYEHPTLPDVRADFSCKSPNPPTEPDVVVDIRENGEWVRLPVTETTLWVNKDGPASITRTAKIHIPAVWGNISTGDFINGFNSQEKQTYSAPAPGREFPNEEKPAYDVCRIFHRDPLTEDWRITHYGYVGGVGPGSTNGTLKFWVYDAADLIRGIPVSKSWGDPTLSNVINFVINGTDDRGRDVGLVERSVFEPPVRTRILGEDVLPAVKRRDVRETVSPQQIENDGGVETRLDKIQDFLRSVGEFGEELGEEFSDTEFAENVNIELTPFGTQKRFQVNRHNMVDHVDWFTSLIDARWWFEPTESGPLFVIDSTAYKPGNDAGTYERREFRDESLVQGGDLTMAVDTLNNNALADIKPFNTLELYGESTTYRERYDGSEQEDDVGSDFSTGEDFTSASAPGAYTEEYPFVKVTYKPLLDRAGGYEYSAQPIESDEVYLSEARETAIDKFREHLSEVTEGTIDLKGEPHALPYDYLTTRPVCNDVFPNANSQPITWEINGVRHETRAGERFVTKLGTSITFDKSQLDVEARYRTT